MRTSFTEQFGIEHPVVLPGMSWISKAPLVAAVSEAGGLGLLATGPLQPDETRAATRESALHDDMKKVIVDKGIEETLYTDRFDGMWARLMKTPTSERVTRRPMGRRVVAEAERTLDELTSSVAAREPAVDVEPRRIQ